MTAPTYRARRALVIWSVFACAMAVAHVCATAWLVRWDAGAHILAHFPPRAADGLAIVAVYVLRLTCYFVMPPVTAWKATRAIIEGLTARATPK